MLSSGPKSRKGITNVTTSTKLTDTRSISQPGIYDGVPMEHYVNDPCPVPSLNAGTINRLLDDSPLHAHSQHPRLGNRRSEPTNRSDIGSAIHSACLGGQGVVYCEIKGGEDTKHPGEIVTRWAQADAKKWRKEQYAAHKIPLLKHQKTKVDAVARKVRGAIERAGHTDLLYEQTAIAQISEKLWFRTRPDFIDHNQRVIGDLKSATKAKAKKWISILFGSGYHTSAALYERVLLELTGEAYEYRWLVQEYDHPYAFSWISLNPQSQEMAEERVARGATLWSKCIDNDRWPSYDERVHYVEPPSWAVWSHEEDALTAEALYELLTGDA